MRALHRLICGLQGGQCEAEGKSGERGEGERSGGRRGKRSGEDEEAAAQACVKRMLSPESQAFKQVGWALGSGGWEDGWLGSNTSTAVWPAASWASEGAFWRCPVKECGSRDVGGSHLEPRVRGVGEAVPITSQECGWRQRMVIDAISPDAGISAVSYGMTSCARYLPSSPPLSVR